MSRSVLPPLPFLSLVVCLAACSGGDSPDGPGAVSLSPLNDTGLLLCAASGESQVDCPQEALPQQDAQFGRDALAQAGRLNKLGAGIGGFDWTKLGADGGALSVQDQAWQAGGSESPGTRWSCVKDHTTGLIWEVKESDPASARYAEHTYTWWSEAPNVNGGFAGKANGGECSGANCDTQGYLDMINRQGLCGFNDWRLPSVSELSSIVVLSRVVPAVDEHFFPNTLQPRFFTSESLARDPKLAWYVYFSDGSVSATNKTDASHVRLVRGEPL